MVDGGERLEIQRRAASFSGFLPSVVLEDLAVAYVPDRPDPIMRGDRRWLDATAPNVPGWARYRRLCPRCREPHLVVNRLLSRARPVQFEAEPRVDVVPEAAPTFEVNMCGQCGHAYEGPFLVAQWQEPQGTHWRRAGPYGHLRLVFAGMGTVTDKDPGPEAGSLLSAVVWHRMTDAALEAARVRVPCTAADCPHEARSVVVRRVGWAVLPFPTSRVETRVPLCPEHEAAVLREQSLTIALPAEGRGSGR